MFKRSRLWPRAGARLGKHRPARPARARPRLEALEGRLAPAVFNVNTTADLSIAAGVNPDGTIVGQGSTVTLRSAIQAANPDCAPRVYEESLAQYLSLVTSRS